MQTFINSLTLEEKACLLAGGSKFHTYGIEHAGIPASILLDGGTGVNLNQLARGFLHKCYLELKTDPDATSEDLEDIIEKMADLVIYQDKAPEGLSGFHLKVLRKAILEYNNTRPEGGFPGCFPPGILLGATWDPEIVHECARALGKEARAYNISVLLGSPNVNIHRDPLNGRLFEGYSEDPYLVSKLAPEFVKGIQEEGVIANVKHFAANNQETNRMSINEHIPVRALHEIYFPGFKACVQEGNVRTVMSAYNSINGKPCAMNHWLLTELLRDKWGFDGFVVSDWGGAYDHIESIASGNDLAMPGPRNVAKLLEAVASGSLSEDTINKCVKNILGVLNEIFPSRKCGQRKLDIEGSKRVAYKAAAEGIVLLKNDNNTLPLKKDFKISFFGEKSKKFLESGGGSANVITDKSSGLYDAAVAKAGNNNVSFESYDDDTYAVVITVSSHGQEGKDRESMDIDYPDILVLKETIKKARNDGKKIIVLLNIAGPVHMMEWINDIDALICVFIPGMEGGNAAADILYGDINPSGKLPLTFPEYYRDCPTYGNFPGENGEVWYGEGIFIGYRYYDYKGIKPLFPFGFGLSYTTFELTDITLNSDIINLDNDESLYVTVKVKNTGTRPGREVVQLYISDETSTLQKPIKELKAFRKVSLNPGESRYIEFELRKQDFASFDTKFNEWITEPGFYNILAGNSSDNICLKKRVKLTGYNPYHYSFDTPVGKLFKDILAVDIIKESISQIAGDIHFDPVSVLKSTLYYVPETKLSAVWEAKFRKHLRKHVEDRKIDEMHDIIYEKLKNIEIE